MDGAIGDLGRKSDLDHLAHEATLAAMMDRCRRVCHRVFGTATSVRLDAEDLMTEASLRVIRAGRSVPCSEDQFLGFFYTVARNAAYKIRRQAAAESAKLKELGRDLQEIQRRAEALTNQATGLEDEEQMARFLASLSPEETLAYMLRIDGATHEEVRAFLGVSVGVYATILDSLRKKVAAAYTSPGS